MRKHIIIATVLITLLSNSCRAATPTPALEAPAPASFPKPQTGAFTTGTFLPNASYSQNIRFEHLSLEEGLSQSVVNVILQDRMGFLWIGTEDGLNRYDGYGFKVYKSNDDDPNTLGDHWITSIAEDLQGYLWIGTRFGGLNRYDPTTGAFTRIIYDITNKNSISSNHITALAADQDGIWVGTETGLDFINYKTQSINHFYANPKEPTSISGNWISALHLDDHGNLWIGTLDAGLNLYDKTSKSFKVFKHSDTIYTSINSNKILSILMDKQGVLWVGTANGLDYSDTAGKYFLHFIHDPQDNDSLISNTIYTIYQDHSNGIWIGTKNGLDRYIPKWDRFIHHQYQPSVSNSLSNNEVFSIFEDRDNILWIGTFGSGLNKYDRQQDHFAYYRQNPDNTNSLSGNFVMPIVVGQSGTAWIGAYGSGLNRFNLTLSNFKLYEHDPENPNSLGTNDIIALELDSEGILWIGTTRGLDRLDPDTGKFTHYTPNPNDPNSLSNAPVYTIYEDTAGELWVGTSSGPNQFDKKTQSFIHYESDELDATGLLNNQVTAILEVPGLDFWIGTFDDGIMRFNPTDGKIIHYRNNPNDSASLGSNSILSFLLDKNNILWIGTAGGGLNRYDPDTNSFVRFAEKQGLPNDVVYGILEDDSGNLWLSTNAGLSQFNPETLTFRNYTVSDGLQSNEFNQNSFAKDKNGFMYFGGINGLTIFRPDDIGSSPYIPLVALTTITSQDGKLLNQDSTAEYLKELVLTWPQDSFEFEFTALAFGQPSKNQYSYMLEGFDKNWIDIKNKRTGRYTNLPGGTYTLRLRGSNSDGVWNENGQSIKIIVVPPYWEMWWFRSLVAFVLVTVLAGGYRLRVKSVEGRNRELERLVQRRTSDLEKRTREIEALYQADEKILRNVTLIQVYQTLVDVSVSMLKADRSVVFVWNEEQEKIMPRVSRGFSAKTLFALNFAEGEGMVGRAMKTGEPIIVSDLKLSTLRADVQTVIREEGIQSFAHFPIIVDGKVMALFNVAYTRPNALNEDTIRLFTALVNRASLSIANMELFEQTKDLAVMEERNRLARDLHDSAKQKAFAALAQLGTANGILKTRPDEVKPHLNEAETLVYEVIQELTFLIQEIYPIALQEKGLPTTLREYIFEWENRNDTEVNVTVQNERSLALDTEQAVYRIIQEALANVARHSRAKRVDVSLVYNIDSLQVLVADDGCGFDMNQRAKGMGFRSMRERIGSIRGTIQIQSAPGQGTRMIAQLPIKG